MQSRHAERVAGQNDEGAQDEPPPSSVRWLIVSAGAGWILVLFVGDFNLFKADLFPRWLILGGAWMATIFLGRPLWARLPIWVTGVGAAVVALVISLLAAGGIGIPTVALGLWTMLALGLNLREDRGCGRLRVFQSRMPALGLAVACAAMAGTFFGLVLPFWRAEAAMARAEEARGRIPPDFERADWAYKLACTSDRYYSRPWLHYASLYENDWVAHGAKPRDDRLKQVTFLLDMAVNPPRNPYAWAAHREYAAVIARVLSRISRQLDPREIIRYQGKIVEECRKASRLNPTNAGLHADLAEASASISMFRDAALEAEEALQLDRITPHLDKKLPDQVRSRLMARLPEWKDRSAQNANLEFRP